MHAVAGVVLLPLARCWQGFGKGLVLAWCGRVDMVLAWCWHGISIVLTLVCCWCLLMGLAFRWINYNYTSTNNNYNSIRSVVLCNSTDSRSRRLLPI